MKVGIASGRSDSDIKVIKATGVTVLLLACNLLLGDYSYCGHCIGRMANNIPTRTGYSSLYKR